MPKIIKNSKDINLELKLTIAGDDYYTRAKIDNYKNLSSKELKIEIKNAVKNMGESQVAAMNQRMRLSHA